jgi:MFS family permease
MASSSRYFLGFTTWRLASASMAPTRAIPQLIVVQVLLGVGQAVVVPASYRWIRYNFVEKERGLAVALYLTGAKLGPAIGRISRIQNCASSPAGIVAPHPHRLAFAENRQLRSSDDDDSGCTGYRRTLLPFDDPGEVCP